MSHPRDQYRQEVIDQIHKIIDDRLDKSKAGPAKRFVELFYRHVPSTDLIDREVEDLYGMALGLWQFGQKRTPNEPKIRVINPSFEAQGWHVGHSVVEIVNDDMPFLVDSITASLNRMGLTVHLIIHPVVKTERDKQGKASDVRAPAKSTDGLSESFMHIEIDEQADKATLRNVEEKLTSVLSDVRASVEDWKPMRNRLEETIQDLKQANLPVDEADRTEVLEFLQWLADDHFTFIGARRYDFVENNGVTDMKVDGKTGLGILRNHQKKLFAGLRRDFSKLPPETQAFLKAPTLLTVNKASAVSTVHRPVHLDAVIVKCFDKDGHVTGERVFVGLFTSVAYNRSSKAIPYLRRKVEDCLRQAGFDSGSHDGKALTHILDTYPRDELFQAPTEALLATALGILGLQERQRTALFLRQDPFERFISALVFVPRDRYDTDFRKRAERILEKAVKGKVTAFYTQLTEGVHARIQFIVQTEPGEIPDYEPQEVERAIIEAARSWSDHLQEALVDAKGEEGGLRLLRRYRDAFPVGYQARTVASAAVLDIDRLEEIVGTGRIGLNLYRPIEAPEHEVRFKLYRENEAIALSDVLPMLENFGLRVIAENPSEVDCSDLDKPLWIHDFKVESADRRAIDLDGVRKPFQDAFRRVWTGDIENDAFNRLVLGAGLTGRQAALLRAYGKYLRQARIAFSQSAIEDTLGLHPEAARLIVHLFTLRFDPTIGECDNDIATTIRDFESYLDGVANLDEDRVLRRYFNLVKATLRTNYFQPSQDGADKPYISFKLRSGEIEDLPLPRPWVEVFVYSPRMEGVHLRGGKVARGGIRWSDRREDFRTEILGLMKAQMVKNAVIVPVGSKGGFVVKRPPPPSEGREAAQAEGIECYKTLIRGMLDITDNIVGDKIVHPDAVVRQDEDDPYLVVAADKGTATFSDIANGVSQDYGFWLDDAFASGGSAGYDHKKMGITARGAWESVKRHFRELGLDTQSEEFTVIGCGDMSGDVFGNGMLLSKKIRLRAAFNHLHIFVDPEPDAAKSFKERKRLFDLGRGSWDQYDKKLISKGGGIFDRKAKTVELNETIRATFGIEAKTLTPNEFIHALLKAPVDLQWFGGIGTYIKADHESHGEVGDKANDTVRVDADELRARVIGEGANLGVTQAGRIEAARHGVKLNTDFIDNSAGVDCSDHEVNIKILLGKVVDNGDLTLKQRNNLLEKMTDEVAGLVLRDNYLQTQALSMAVAEAPDLLDQQARMMKRLEKVGRLDRTVELLPGEEELTELMGRREGLARPELAVILSYAKIELYDRILDSTLPDDPSLAQDLVVYFPEPLRDRFRDEIEQHRLRRELIATSITNSMINRTGPTFVSEMGEVTGMGPANVARAYLIVRDSFELRGMWAEVEALDNKVDAQVQTHMLLLSRRLIERATAWVLRNVGENLDVGREVAHFRPGVRHIEEHLEEILYDRALDVLHSRAETQMEHGVPEALARRVASLNVMASGLDLIRIADTTDVPVKNAAPRYFELGDRLGIAWLRDSAQKMPTGSHWQKQAVAAIIDDLYALQADIAINALSIGGKKTKPEKRVNEWLDQRAAPLERIGQLIAELKALDHVDVSMLAVANRRLRGLIAG